LEDQITIVEEAESHGKYRPAPAGLPVALDVRLSNLPHRFRTTENRAKRGKARVSCMGNRGTRA